MSDAERIRRPISPSRRLANNIAVVFEGDIVTDVELRHLRYFVTVAEQLSFRRAAERLHLSHPTLTKQINDLENELGLKLFIRNHRQVELTEVGRGFLVDARRTLASAQQAIAHAHEVATGERGRLTLGTIGALSQVFLDDALARFRELFPLVEVTVLHLDTRAQIEALLDDSIMLGITFRGPSFDEIAGEELTMKLLLRCPYCVVYSKHRSLPKGRAPKLSDFRDDNFLTFSPGILDDYEHVVRSVCQLYGRFEPKLLPVGNTADSLMSMVVAGRGVFLRPEIALRGRTLAVSYYVLPETETRYEIYVVGRKNSGQVATANNFLNILFEVVRRLPGETPDT
jgi:DNA-binding transcriptional LysR family regulator